MRKRTALVFIAILSIGFCIYAYNLTKGNAATGGKPTSIYDFALKDIDGKKVSLSEFRGKVVLVVNVASKCGFTPQYEGLEKLYLKYADKGFVILGFPANNFMGQEPGTD